MAGTYKFMGCTIKCLGYYEPEHRVVWEAVDDKTGCAVAHGYTLRECELRIAEDKANEERDRHWIGILSEFKERLGNVLRCYSVIDDTDAVIMDIIKDIESLEETYKKN